MKEFKKSDLKTGMIVEFIDGTQSKVLKGTSDGDIFAGMNGNRETESWFSFDNPSSNKIIIKVWDADFNYKAASIEHKGDLLWERKDEVEYKDGDIVIDGYDNSIDYISIIRNKSKVYVTFDKHTKIFSTSNRLSKIKRLATEEEKQLLFDELKKQKGLKWDSDKKELVKIEKPFLELDGVEYSESTLRSLIKKATNN